MKSATDLNYESVTILTLHSVKLKLITEVYFVFSYSKTYLNYVIHSNVYYLDSLGLRKIV